MTNWQELTKTFNDSDMIILERHTQDQIHNHILKICELLGRNLTDEQLAEFDLDMCSLAELTSKQQ